MSDDVREAERMTTIRPEDRAKAERIMEDVIFLDLRDRGGIGDTLDDIKYNDEEVWAEIISVGRDAIALALSETRLAADAAATERAAAALEKQAVYRYALADQMIAADKRMEAAIDLAAANELTAMERLIRSAKAPAEGGTP